MPTVSVIVPVYKAEPYIRRCVDSILAQTFTDFEVILVNDGSPDNCGAICDEYAQKDSRVRVIHQENGGVSSARNTALDHVTGQYLTFCDSDDQYEKTWLQSLVTKMEDANADVVLGGFVKMLGDQVTKIRQHKPELLTCMSTMQKLDYCIYKVLERIHGWEVWVRLFRTNVIREKQIRFCETCWNFAEDMGFTLEYALHASRVAVIGDTGYCYMERSGSMMHTSVGKVKLDSMNEIALQVLHRIDSYFAKNETRKIQPVIHYLIMHNQYEQITTKDQYRRFQSDIRKLQHYNEWKKWTWRLFGCKRMLQKLFGKQRTKWIMLHTFYHLFGMWPVFALGSELLEREEKRLK